MVTESKLLNSREMSDSVTISDQLESGTVCDPIWVGAAPRMDGSHEIYGI